MPITNNNLKMIDRPIWEQLTSAPANTAAGSSFADDDGRFVYILYAANSFWQYDTWHDTWMQLASPPGGTLAGGSTIRFCREMGSQVNGVVYGSVYALIASGTAVVFYRYDIGTNTWSGALSVVNVPATWGTDGRLMLPDPCLNNNQGGYHGATSLVTVTTSAQANAGATTISVNALSLALPTNTVLNFGTKSAPIYAVLTASASASATSITVSALVATVPNASVAYWYADMYLFGNNATVMYRYNINGNAWTTTSSNAGNPALPAVTGAMGQSCIVTWLPGSGEANALNRLVLIRSSASSSIYEYDLVTNTFSTITYYPNTETFTIGTSSAIRKVNGKSAKILIAKDVTGRIYEFDRLALRMTPKATQNIITSGAALVGDKMFMMTDPTGTIDFVYLQLSTSAYFLRSAMIY